MLPAILTFPLTIWLPIKVLEPVVADELTLALIWEMLVLIDWVYVLNDWVYNCPASVAAIDWESVFT